MEPVGQKSRFEAISPSTDGLSYEFLLKLLDLSRAETPGMKIIVSLPAALLTKAFDAASSLPVRFIMKASPLRNELEQLLGESSSGPVTLEVERDGNRLLWNFRGKNIALSLASPLILSRPLPILLEDPQPVPKPDLPSGGPETLLPTRTILAYSSPSQDEPVSRGGRRSRAFRCRNPSLGGTGRRLARVFSGPHDRAFRPLDSGGEAER